MKSTASLSIVAVAIVSLSTFAFRAYSAPLVAELSSTRAAHEACAELIAHSAPEVEVFEIASR